MAPSDARVHALSRRLLLARMSLLSEHGFYGVLLMHMRFAMGDELDTAWVSSDTITFNPDFLEGLGERELLFVLEHEVLHAALGHVSRRREDMDGELFNVACDIVVNSNILWSNGMDPGSITLAEFGESMHLTPAGEEGYLFTAEEVYEMLADDRAGKGCPAGSTGAPGEGGPPDPPLGTQGRSLDRVRQAGRERGWDWHIPACDDSEDQTDDGWAWLVRGAREAMRARDPSGRRGLVPLGVERLLGELSGPRVDWRRLLNDFVQEEVNDWSFSVPDRRFSESPYILPSYCETDAALRHVAFMVDASGSVSDDELAAVVSEISGALEQFGGRMDGWVGFFDTKAYGLAEIGSVEDVRSLRPRGGGGTRLEAAFEAVDEWVDDEAVSCIVILTDGYAPFPEEARAKGTPVLWLLSSKDVQPPWGRVVHLSDERL